MEDKPKKLPCPFVPTNFSFTNADPSSIISSLVEVADQSPESFSLDNEMKLRVAQDLDGLLERSKEQLELLEERAKMLQDMIKNQFGIEDHEKWLAEQAKETKPITLTIPSDVLSNKASGSASVAPTTLRIKLVEKPPSSATQQRIPPVGRGQGSKNLSRMNRPQDEAAKAKAATQIPINVFWNQAEVFFKPIDENDFKFLNDPSRIVDPSPFIIPPLGKPFLEQWKHHYGYVASGHQKSTHLLNFASDQFKPSLKDRLLSLLVDEEIPIEDRMEVDEEVDAGQPEGQETDFMANNYVFMDYTHLDSRLRHELAATGFEEFANCAVDYQEDDSICIELRSLQRRLQEQLAVNYLRKRKLAEVTKSKLPAQEFYSLLSDLDKQIEQVFIKRTRSGKKKKKSGASNGGSVEPSSAAPAEAVRLLENRAKLLVAFAPYIPKLPEYLASEEVKLVDKSEENMVVRMAQESGSWLPLPSNDTFLQTEFSKPLPSAQPGSRGSSMDVNGGIDPEILYHSNSEWITLEKNLEVLKEQLAQAKKDVETLESQKEAALNDPETFVSALQSGTLVFPKMQSIARIPDLDLGKYTKRTSRRGNTKYEQNLEFLLARVNAIHKRSAVFPPVLLSSSIPVSSLCSTPLPALTGHIRERFFEITGGPPIRPVSAPAPAYSGTDTPFSSGRVTPIGGDSMGGSADSNSRSGIDQPRAQRVHRVSLVENEHVTTHYNLPWSEEEKKRLEELLVIFPEEPVSSRRYAKIAEALGTRTASQITNRIHKLNAKRSKIAKREAEAAREQAAKLLKSLKRSGVNKDGSPDDELMLEVDDETKQSADYQEYLRLKEQLDEIKAQVIEHAGYQCDGCSMEPIIGIRFHCEACTNDYDLCQNCMASNTHDPSHSFAKVITASSRPEQPQ